MDAGVIERYPKPELADGDRGYDFGNFIPDDDEQPSPNYFTGYQYETPLHNETMTKNKKEHTKQNSNSVEALVRHFKIFFPKQKRSQKQQVIPAETQQQSGGLRSFSFTDSKMGKDFDQFTKGQSLNIYSLSDSYFSEFYRHKTEPLNHAPPVRSRIVGDKSVFQNSLPQLDSKSIVNDHCTSLSSQLSEIEHGEHTTDPMVFHEAITSDHPQKETNEYLLPDGKRTNLTELSQYANFKTLDDSEESMLAISHSHKNDTSRDEERLTSRPYSDSGNSDSTYGHFRRAKEPSPSLSQKHFGNGQIATRHKSLTSLSDAPPPPPPPVNPNRPVYQDETLKVFRSPEVSEHKIMTDSQKYKTPNVFGKALRRFSSYFSLKKDKQWQTDYEENSRQASQEKF